MPTGSPAYSPRSKAEKAMFQADKIASEAIKRLGTRKVKNLSLEESLEIKELANLGARGIYEFPGIKYLSGELEDHIKSPYGLESAGEEVKSLENAYKQQRKIIQDIQDLEALTGTTGQDLYSLKVAPFRSGDNREGRFLLIKSLEEGFNMAVEEWQQKKKEKKLIDIEIKRIISEIERLKREYLDSHPRPGRNSGENDKMIAWGIVEDAKLAAARGLISPRSARVSADPRSREDARASAWRDWAHTDGAAAIRWAEQMQGVVPPPPPPSPPSLSAIPLSAYNSVEQKAQRQLNARESKNAAAVIFPKETRKNKPKWGIPNFGTGFGGGYTRRRKRVRKIKNNK
jgi:hypothetical protein